jgi:hypothetical protein
MEPRVNITYGTPSAKGGGEQEGKGEKRRMKGEGGDWRRKYHSVPRQPRLGLFYATKFISRYLSILTPPLHSRFPH